MQSFLLCISYPNFLFHVITTDTSLRPHPNVAISHRYTGNAIIYELLAYSWDNSIVSTSSARLKVSQAFGSSESVLYLLTPLSVPTHKVRPSTSATLTNVSAKPFSASCRSVQCADLSNRVTPSEVAIHKYLSSGGEIVHGLFYDALL